MATSFSNFSGFEPDEELIEHASGQYLEVLKGSQSIKISTSHIVSTSDPRGLVMDALAELRRRHKEEKKPPEIKKAENIFDHIKLDFFLDSVCFDEGTTLSVETLRETKRILDEGYNKTSPDYLSPWGHGR